MLNRRSRTDGVSLIELLIALTIAGALFLAAIPSFTSWIQNSQIRTVTEAIYAGIQFTKSEAIKRNQPVEIVFDPDFHAWSINLVNPPTLLRRESGLANLNNIQVLPDVQNADRLTFSGLGRALLTNPTNNSARFNQLSIDHVLMAQTESQDLTVIVSAAGAVRMCNPNKVAPDPRAC